MGLGSGSGFAQADSSDINSRHSVIVQARMGSTRLPGKVLESIAGHPVLWHIISRLKKMSTINDIIIATTKKEEDNSIVSLTGQCGVKVFRGNENNVLDRYFKASTEYNADIIVRITADCPLIDPIISDSVVEEFIGGDFDSV